VLAAVLVFAAWEGFVAAREGMSPFLFQLGLDDVTRRGHGKLALLLPLLTVVGSVAPALALLAWVYLRVPGRFIVAGGVVTAGAFVALIGWDGGLGMFIGLGVAVWGTIALAVGRLLANPPNAPDERRLDCLLIGWLVLEIAVYFLISPFPAVRRVLGMVVVMTLLVGRLAARTGGGSGRRGWVIGVTAGGVALGLAYAIIDLCEARARADVADRAAQIIRDQDGEATIWYLGHWGFQYYAEHLGMKPVVPDHSRLQPGDWLVVADSGVPRPVCTFDRDQLTAAGRVVGDDALPLQTVVGYYAGNKPIAHRGKPRIILTFWHAEKTGVPSSAYPPEFVVTWAARRNRPPPPAAIPALVRAIGELGGRGPGAASTVPPLRQLCGAEDERISQAARAALEHIAP
jgi:hypothetical protein